MYAVAPFKSELPKTMYWKEVWTYTIVGGIYRHRKVWEMVEETNEDENEFTCKKCDCKFKTATSSEYHFNTSHTPTGRDFLKAMGAFFSLNKLM